jgi:hypothetical protein
MRKTITIREDILASLIIEGVNRELAKQGYYLNEGEKLKKLKKGLKKGVQMLGAAAATTAAFLGGVGLHDSLENNGPDPVDVQNKKEISDFMKGQKYADEYKSRKAEDNDNKTISWKKAKGVDESIIRRIVSESIRKYINKMI